MPRSLFVSVVGSVWLVPVLASAEPPLYLPWTCEDVYHVTNGHNTNSHTGKDAWAWDFGLPVGTDVLAPAAGIVRLVKMNSDTGGCDGAYANDANYVVIDFDDGTEVLYMHLAHQSSTLQVGDAVEQGDVVGRVGLTGWVCGAHLHMQVQSTCDSWYCQSFSAEFVDYGDPAEDVPLPSNNCPVIEPCELVLDGTSTTIDDADGRCFRKVSSWWWPGDGGWQDTHQWTWTNDDAEPDTMGRWEFGVQVPGSYRVSAFIPDAQANSQMATYDIQTGAEIVAVGPIDQSTNKGWVDLGVHEFVEGEEHWVRLRDNTGEHRDLDREIAFDAIRLEWAPAGADTGETGEGSGSNGEASDGAGASDSDVPADDDGGSPTTEDSGGGALPLPPSANDDDAGGCAIGTRPGVAALGLLVLFAMRRRARR